MKKLFAALWLAAFCAVAQTQTIGPPAGSGGTPGGSTTQCQYNNAGAFGGITGCTTNGTVVTLASPLITTMATISGATTTGPDLEVAVTGDTNSRIAIGVNTTDVARLSFGPGNAVRDLFLERLGAGSLRHGAPDAAAPVAQTISVQNVVAGTSNTAGANTTLKGSQGTGTGAGGSIIFQVAPAGSTGTSQNALATALTIGADTPSVTVGSASFGLSGDISAPAWTTAGIRYKNVTATLTDTTSSGTVAAARTDNFGGNTIAASSATTYTSYYSAYFNNPTAGTNVTMTNKSALGADSVSIGGAAQGTNAVAVTGIVFASGGFATSTGSTTSGLYGTGGHPIIVDGNPGTWLILNNPDMYISSSSKYGFGSTTNYGTAVMDANISRNAAGVTQFGTTAANALGSLMAVNGTYTGTISTSSTTDATTTTSGALQVAGGMAIRKRVFIDGITVSAGLQTAVLCQSSAGEMIADTVACLASAAKFKNVRGLMPDGALAKLASLPIDLWSYKAEGNFQSDTWTRERIGPLADDVAAMDPRLAGYDADGNVRTYSTEQLLAYTIKALQELKADNDNLRLEVRQQRAAR